MTSLLLLLLFLQLNGLISLSKVSFFLLFCLFLFTLRCITFPAILVSWFHNNGRDRLTKNRTTYPGFQSIIWAPETKKNSLDDIIMRLFIFYDLTKLLESDKRHCTTFFSRGLPVLLMTVKWTYMCKN